MKVVFKVAENRKFSTSEARDRTVKNENRADSVGGIHFKNLTRHKPSRDKLLVNRQEGPGHTMDSPVKLIENSGLESVKDFRVLHTLMILYAII